MGDTFPQMPAVAPLPDSRSAHGNGNPAKTAGANLARWHVLLRECVEVVEAALHRAGFDGELGRQSECVMLALSEYLGGKRIYLPRPDSAGKALRDARVWAEFDGRNVTELAKRFRLSERQVYRILRTQRQVEKEWRDHRCCNQNELSRSP